MSKFGLYPTDMKISCSTFQCYGRAAYYLGKDDSPNGTTTIICQECADSLIGNIVLEHANPIPQELPFEPTNEELAEPADMLFDRPVSDWTIAELKEKAAELGLEVKSKMNKADLVHLIEGAV
jgi:hypothetical protein